MYRAMRTLTPLPYRRMALATTSAAPPSIPWFVDQEEATPTTPKPPAPAAPLPSNTPQTLRDLHSVLLKSPLLDHSARLVREPIPFPPGPRLPDSIPRGRRRRGGSYPGEGFMDAPSSIWSWIVLAQVHFRSSP